MLPNASTFAFAFAFVTGVCFGIGIGIDVDIGICIVIFICIGLGTDVEIVIGRHIGLEKAQRSATDLQGKTNREQDVEVSFHPDCQSGLTR